MNSQTHIRIGGVPEHFNHPVKRAIKNGDFQKVGLSVEWRDFYGGTGEMNQALRDGSTDLCILLTEGIIKDITRGNPSRLVSVYVNTPLCWGVHTGAGNSLDDYGDIWDKRFAISRFGSGSHLMPLVDAKTKDKSLEDKQFVVVNNLDSALESLSNNETDVFYWEKFTTKPFVDNGTLRRIGEFYSPWPCFVIAGRKDFLDSNTVETRKALNTIHASCRSFMQQDDAADQIASIYNLEPKDARRWFHSTEWAEHGWISNKMINGVLYNLETSGLIETKLTASELIWQHKKTAN